MENDTTTRAIEWQLRPLCREYLAVFFETVPIKVMRAWTGPDDRPLRLALGVLGDGRHELMGVWSEPSQRWPNVFENLKSRGVEKIRFVATEESATRQGALEAAFPGATLMPSVRPGENLAGMPSRYRGSIRAGLDVMKTLRRRSKRVVDRHGCFSSQSYAIALVVDALERAERRIGFVGIARDSVAKSTLDARARVEQGRGALR